MRNLLFYILVLTTPITSCQSKQDFNHDKYLIYQDSLPKTSNLISVEYSISPQNKIEVMELEESRNKDSEWNPISKNDRQKKFDLRVVVDTKDTLSIDIEKYWGYQMPKLKYTIFNKADSDSSLVQALPVYIFNLDTTKQIYLETQDGRVLMICEAKDDKGKWKPIEYWQYSWCGNSYYDSELKRNECAVIKVLNFGGSFETELRYKLKNYDSVYYSNSFQGSIDINQFTLPKDYQNSRITRKFDSLDYLDFIYFKN